VKNLDWTKLLVGFGAGLLTDKVVEYAYVKSGLYEQLGHRSWDDLILNYAGVGLAYYRKELGLGFLTGVNTGLLLSFFDIWLGRVMSGGSLTVRREKLKQLTVK